MFSYCYSAQRGYNIRHLGYKAATVGRDGLVQVEKLPEAKQAGGGIIQQPCFWGSPANRVKQLGCCEAPALRKGLAEALGRCQPAVAPEGHWQWGWEEAGEMKKLSH